MRQTRSQKYRHFTLITTIKSILPTLLFCSVTNMYSITGPKSSPFTELFTSETTIIIVTQFGPSILVEGRGDGVPVGYVCPG